MLSNLKGTSLQISFLLKCVLYKMLLRVNTRWCESCWRVRLFVVTVHLLVFSENVAKVEPFWFILKEETHPPPIHRLLNTLNSYHMPDTTLDLGLYQWANIHKKQKSNGILFTPRPALEENSIILGIGVGLSFSKYQTSLKKVRKFYQLSLIYMHSFQN